MATEFRRLPAVDRVLASEPMQQATAELGHETATEAVRQELAERRVALSSGSADVSVEEVAEAAAERAYAALRSSLRPVINATGVIIHTNLGRVPLSESALAAMSAIGGGYSNLEFELEAGERGSRYGHVEALLCRVTGAEAAIAVNNNAAALLLVLSALAKDREVVISRGQLVEIGGGFRIPDVMAQSGAHLVEVGTTNRTYVRDYAEALTEETVGLMRVHSSNFRVVGFTETPELAAMAQLARERGLLLLDDLGSGCLLDTKQYGLSEEPTPPASIRAGADLVMFSGDKLLGGPQAGIVVGKSELIARLRRHPLARALRMDKASIAGLNATLLHYARGDAEEQVPVWRMIAAPVSQLNTRARRLARSIGSGATVVDGRSMIGGGSLPEESLPAKLVVVPARSGAALEDLARRLRTAETPVVGRIEKDALLLDPRTIARSEEAALVRAVKTAREEQSGPV